MTINNHVRFEVIDQFIYVLDYDGVGVRYQVDSPVRRQIRNQVLNQVSTQVRDQVRSQVYDQTRDDIHGR